MKIVTDCAADMSGKELEELGVVQAPLYIQFPDGEVSSEEITADAFYDRLEAMQPDMPTTAMPSAGLLAEIYSRVARAGPEHPLSAYLLRPQWHHQRRTRSRRTASPARQCELLGHPHALRWTALPGDRRGPGSPRGLDHERHSGAAGCHPLPHRGHLYARHPGLPRAWRAHRPRQGSRRSVASLEARDPRRCRWQVQFGQLRPHHRKIHQCHHRSSSRALCRHAALGDGAARPLRGKG